MLWLADENIPRDVVVFLREMGEDVLAIAEHHGGISDQDVIRLARTQGRFLLSFDRDHGELIYGRAVPPPPAVVFLRLFPPNSERLQQLLSWLIGLGESTIAGQFIVVSNSAVRRRALPLSA